MPSSPTSAAPGSTWLDERQQHAWRSLLAMQTQLGAHLRRSLARDAGMSDSDYDVLVQLSEAPEQRRRAFQLAQTLQWEKSRLSHQLRRMEQRGLLVRTECETDGRGAYAELTPKGAAAIAAAAPLHVAEVRRHFVDPLTPAQLDSLVEICATVLGSFDPDPTRPTDSTDQTAPR